MITENLSTLKIHKLTQEQYDRELEAGRIDETALYLTPDEEIDLSGYATVDLVDGKANLEHEHEINDVKNLQTTLDTMNLSISGKANTVHPHDEYYGKTEGEALADTLAEVKKDVDDFFKDALGDTDAQQVKDTLREIQDYITSDVEAAQEMLNQIAGKADTEHKHEIEDVAGLQAALNGKADAEHGTHVEFSTDAPQMDGTASAGTATTVAHSDHVHPTDTSRAAQSDLNALESVVKSKADASALSGYYTKEEIDAMELITVGDIDTICGTTIQLATVSEVTF